MTKISAPLVGVWRLVKVGGFEPDYVDMLGPAYLSIDAGGTGHIEFGVVSGTLDLRPIEKPGTSGVEFSWDGFDEEQPINGRGTAIVVDTDLLEGALYFHLGDDYAFTARRTTREALRRGQPAPKRLGRKRDGKSKAPLTGRIRSSCRSAG